MHLTHAAKLSIEKHVRICLRRVVAGVTFLITALGAVGYFAVTGSAKSALNDEIQTAIKETRGAAEAAKREAYEAIASARAARDAVTRAQALAEQSADEASAKASALQGKLDTARTFIGGSANEIATELVGTETFKVIVASTVALQRGEVPVGTVIAYAGPIDDSHPRPPGWLVCDGKEYESDKYPKLSEALDGAWGTVSTGRFKVPDLGGRFLRGVDKNEKKNAPDVAKRVPLGTRGPDDVGSIQEDAIQRHVHTIAMSYGDAGRNEAKRAVAGKEGPEMDAGDFITGATLRPEDVRVASETRPMNAHAYWLIKH